MSGLGPLPRIHPREKLVNDARAVLSKAVSDATEGLTEGEALKVVTQTLSDYVLGVAKYAIREERHPGQPDKPGGLT